LLNLANSYTVLKAYDSAYFYLDKASQLQSRIEVPDSYRGFLYYQKARIELDQSNHEKGRTLIRKAIEANNKELQMFQALNKLNFQLKGVPYYQGELASSYLATGEYDKGLKEIQFGLETISQNFEGADLSENPAAADVLNLGSTAALLIVKGELLQKKARQTANDNLLDIALKCYQLADEFSTEYNKTFTNKADVFLLEQRWRTIYTHLIELSSDLADKYSYMEKARALQFRRNNNEVVARSKSDIPPELIQFEDSIKQHMAKSKTNMLSQVDSISALASIEYFKNSRKLDSLLAYYNQEFPLYYQMKFRDNITTVSSIQQSLDDETLLIQFHVSEKAIYAFSTNSSDAVVDEVPLTDDLRNAILLCKEQLASSEAYDQQVFAANAYFLYDKLLSTVLVRHQESGISKLVILPDDLLWNINFELLYTVSPDTDLDGEPPYLLRDYAIRYEHSLSVTSDRKGAGKAPNKNLLAFSYGEVDVTESGNQVALSLLRSTNEELPGSRVEIKRIANLVDGDYYYGTFASEQQFKAIAQDYRVLHLAVHGITDSDEPDHSRLDFFYHGDSLEDGQLHAFELYNMELNADMAVLSACNTGSGSIIVGEGIMSLGRAFSYAGVNSLVLTRWEVSDAFTP
ncbi:MAG: CHAT domain-containing protein, partial [Bacteroidota bacterium]